MLLPVLDLSCALIGAVNIGQLGNGNRVRMRYSRQREIEDCIDKARDHALIRSLLKGRVGDAVISGKLLDVVFVSRIGFVVVAANVRPVQPVSPCVQP